MHSVVTTIFKFEIDIAITVECKSSERRYGVLANPINTVFAIKTGSARVLAEGNL